MLLQKVKHNRMCRSKMEAFIKSKLDLTSTHGHCSNSDGSDKCEHTFGHGLGTVN